MGVRKLGRVLEEAFRQAEIDRRCLVPEDDSMRRSLNRCLEASGAHRPDGLVSVTRALLVPSLLRGDMGFVELGAWSQGTARERLPVTIEKKAAPALLGISADTLDNLVISPYPGLFARLCVWNALIPQERMRHIMRALHAVHPTWVFCFTSAAIMHGFDISYRLMNAIHIEENSARRTSFAVRHSCRPPRCSVVEADGVPTTELPWTVFSCVRDLSFPFALGIVDAYCRLGACERGATDDSGSFGAAAQGSSAPTDAETLLREAELFRGCRGIRRFRAIAGLANGLSENGGESYARAVMYEQGVMIPQLQVELPNILEGGRPFRTDFLWEESSDRVSERGVIGEMDGVGKTEDRALLRGRTTRDALRAERQRESRLTGLGFAVARFTFAEVRRVEPFIRTLDAFGVPRMALDADLLEAVGPKRTCKPYVNLR